MSVEEQLAVITKIRQEISNDKSITDDDLMHLTQNTNLLNMVF